MKTQVSKEQIGNNTLTGASFHPSLGIWDETRNYAAGETVFWKNKIYNITSPIIGTTEGDLTNAPDVSASYTESAGTIFSAYSDTTQAINTTDTVLLVTSIDTASGAFSLADNVITSNIEGLIFINANMSVVGKSTISVATYLKIEVDSGSGFVTRPNYLGCTYNTSTTARPAFIDMLVPVNVSVGDKIRFTSYRVGGDNPNSLKRNITIFNTSAVSGPAGPIGPVGPSGDIRWLGDYTPGTYNTNDAVQYQGSSYVSTVNSNISTPPSATWDLVAAKGTDGAGTTVIVKNKSVSVPNTPHGTLDFSGMYVADAGAGTVSIQAVPMLDVMAYGTNGGAQTFSSTEVKMVIVGNKDSAFSTITSNNFNILRNGVYRIKAKVNIASALATDRWPSIYYKIGTTVVAKSRCYGHTRSNTQAACTNYIDDIITLTAGNLISFYVINSGVTNNNTVASESLFSVEFLSAL